jgi:TPR repeat protein
MMKAFCPPPFQSSDESACDRAASAPYDPDRRSGGVIAPQLIMSNTGHLVCADEVNEPLAPARANYQLGRQLRALGDLAAARRQFEIAAARGYRAAKIDLADILIDSRTVFADRSRASELYEQAWRSGVAIAAFKLGKLYEQQDPSGRVPSGAWQWYQQGAHVREPNSLARLAEREEQNAVAADNQSLRNDHLLQAFGLYTSAAARAHDENWPDEAWQYWRYRRASIARLLGGDGMMGEVGRTYRSSVSEVRNAATLIRDST